MMDTRHPIYLDYAATTPVDKRVVETMSGYLGMDGVFANPASVDHAGGAQAAAAVNAARARLVEAVNARPSELIWTSGATEADNLALKGAVQAADGETPHIVTVSTEHKAVTDTCRHLENKGARVTRLHPDTDGLIQPAAVAAALEPDTAVVSVMWVNNETGVMQDIPGIARVLHGHRCLFHVDGAQALGRIGIDLEDSGVDLLSLSGHKIYAPKGIGALYVRRSARGRLTAQMHGGGHEQGLRAGTLATHQIVAMGEAASLARDELFAESARIRALSGSFLESVQALPGVHLNGHPEQRAPHILNLRFDGVDGEALMADLAWRGRGLAVSGGAACSAATREPSHVLRELGLDDEQARASVRFSLGRFTHREEITAAAEKTRDAVSRLRRISPLWDAAV